MYVSVILSTYNHPKWLHKVLTGYAAQTRRPDQILIADDGSTNETALLVPHQPFALEQLTRS